MDITFEVEGGNHFTILAYPYERIFQIKEKVEKSQGILISRQTFIFNGQLLQDAHYVFQSQLHHGAHVHLRIDASAAAAANPASPPPMSDSDLQLLSVPELQLPTLPPQEYVPSVMPPWDPSSQLIPTTYFHDPLGMPAPPRRLMLKVKLPNSENRIPIGVELYDSVLQLKSILARQDLRGVSVERIVLRMHSTGVELLDNQVLKDCAVSENPEIDVFLKMRVKVLPMNSREVIEFEVYPEDNVRVLREKLERLRRTRPFRLPEDGSYFFIHMQQDMHEDETFLWHQVSHVIDMEIILEVVGSDEFSVEVGPFDTAFNVKETVQKLYHIPIFLQNFFFNGQLIHDHLYFWTSQIFDGSRIQLVIAPSVSMPSQQLQPELPPPLPTVPSDNDDYIPFWKQPEIPQLIPTSFGSSQFLMTEFPPSTQVPSNRTDKPPSPQQPPPPRVTLNFKVPNSNYRIPIEAELNDTVLHLKEKIVAREEIMPGVPVERIVLESAWTRMMLFDNQILKDSAVSINGEIDVFVKPSPAVAGDEKVKVKVKVLPMLAREKIDIEVSVSDNVAVLREELNKLHRTLRFRLPLPEDGGYFFIHRKWVMHEEKSFQWHGVSDGDTIETFDGCAREYDDASSSTSSSKPSPKRQR
ncbi:hypothetical protein Fmac_023410 [Flemingia macrophylla]|uniref:Ubiquitin-like domain-containing protein n=1 Tax=Flemingia macrophylla TaxID=520843 RepID=A0ABD1LLG0_9FABA